MAKQFKYLKLILFRKKKIKLHLEELKIYLN